MYHSPSQKKMGAIKVYTAEDVYNRCLHGYRARLNSALADALDHQKMFIRLATKTKDEADVFCIVAEEYNKTSGAVVLRLLKFPTFHEYIAFALVERPVVFSRDTMVYNLRANILMGPVHVWVIHILTWIFYYVLWKVGDLKPPAQPWGWILISGLTVMSIIAAHCVYNLGDKELDNVEKLVKELKEIKKAKEKKDT